MSKSWIILVVVLSCSLVIMSCGDSENVIHEADSAEEAVLAVGFGPASHTYELAGPLVPSNTTMVTAWDLPKNPLTDPTLGDSDSAEQIRRGFRLFTATPDETPRLTPSRMTCGHCHLNAGQRELALPLVGSAGMFPEYNRRAGKLFTLEDRIVGCFMRSENSVGLTNSEGQVVAPEPDFEEIAALAAYITWLSSDFLVGQNPPWRQKNRIVADALVSIDHLDFERGESLFTEHCVNCHGADGQGVQVGDKRAGPLWGPSSWNDGAGASRYYTLAGFIRYAMPYLNPGVLSDEEAQHVASYIIAQPRPEYPFKADDYQKEELPIDAVSYKE